MNADQTTAETVADPYPRWWTVAKTVEEAAFLAKMIRETEVVSDAEMTETIARKMRRANRCR